MDVMIILVVVLLLLLLKEVGSARLGESDIHHISPKTPAPQYSYMSKEEDKEINRRQKGIQQLRLINKHWPCS